MTLADLCAGPDDISWRSKGLRLYALINKLIENGLLNLTVAAGLIEKLIDEGLTDAVVADSLKTKLISI